MIQPELQLATWRMRSSCQKLNLFNVTLCFKEVTGHSQAASSQATVNLRKKKIVIQIVDRESD